MSITQGKDCNFGVDVIIGDGAVIGDRVRICDYTVICPNAVIADDVYIGYQVTFVDNDYMDESRKPEPPTVKRGAKIGHKAVLGHGVVIGENAIVGVGAVVTTDVPPGEMWFGVPARRVRRVPPKEMK